MQVFDGLLEEDFERNIVATLLGSSFPWYFIKDLTGGSDTLLQSRPACKHQFVKNGIATSNYTDMLNLIVAAVAKETKTNFNGILKARAFLQFPLSNSLTGEDTLDTFHVDTTIDHKVILYYVCDSDGDTIVTDKEYNNELPTLLPATSELNIIEKITPKQGRILHFDGKLYHTACQPKHNVRCVINIDVI